LPGILPGSFAAGGRSSDHRAQLPGDLGRKLGISWTLRSMLDYGLTAIDRCLSYRQHLADDDPGIAVMAYDAGLRNLAVIGEASRSGVYAYQVSSVARASLCRTGARLGQPPLGGFKVTADVLATVPRWMDAQRVGCTAPTAPAPPGAAATCSAPTRRSAATGGRITSEELSSTPSSSPDGRSRSSHGWHPSLSQLS